MARRFKRKFKQTKSRKKTADKLQKWKSSIKNWLNTVVLDKAKTYIRNLSDYKLDQFEILALSKGPKFIPFSTQKRSLLVQDFNNFETKLRKIYHMKSSCIRVNHPFRGKSSGHTPLACHSIEDYLYATKVELSDMKPINKKCIYNIQKDALII